jgi:DNA invertase Pin-like site-specific DNA recombinase
MNSRPRNAAIYVRLSQDRAGEGLAVGRQEEDSRALADRKGWTVAGIYPDNDTSATNGKPREHFERMWADVEAGVVDAVIAYSVDRLTRTPVELERIIALAERHDVALATVTGDIDLATPSGQLVARILGSAARHEVDQKVARQRRANQQHAEMGRPWKGGYRPFGYLDDRVTVDEAEAVVIREVAARLLAHESLASIARDLRQRGIVAPGGSAWTPPKLKRMVASARISGRREVVGTVKGTRPLTGTIVAVDCWPAIITVKDSDAIRALLTGRQSSATQRTTGRRYMLSGLLRCALCGNGLSGRAKWGGGQPGSVRYVCAKVPGGPGCGKVSVSLSAADSTVIEAVCAALAGSNLAAVRRSPAVDDELAEIRRITDDIQALDDDVTAGILTYRDARALRTALVDAREAANTRAARAMGATALDGLVGSDYADLIATWPTMTLSRQRAVVSSLIAAVTVQPAAGTRFDRARLVIDWLG